MKKTIKTTAPPPFSEAQQKLREYRAKHENDLNSLLRPWYTFRTFFKFKKAYVNGKGEKRDSNHFYGTENSCTYNQCLHGHVENIILDKAWGFNNCIYMIEEKYREENGAPTFLLARIYMRSVTPNGPFETLIREYDRKGERQLFHKPKRGEPFELKDPVLTPEDNQVLYFLINKMECLEISAEPVPTPNEFRELVKKSLIKTE